jgi:hypothetical protein
MSASKRCDIGAWRETEAAQEDQDTPTAAYAEEAPTEIWEVKKLARKRKRKKRRKRRR